MNTEYFTNLLSMVKSNFHSLRLHTYYIHYYTQCQKMITLKPVPTIHFGSFLFAIEST